MGSVLIRRRSLQAVALNILGLVSKANGSSVLLSFSFSSISFSFISNRLKISLLSSKFFCFLSCFSFCNLRFIQMFFCSYFSFLGISKGNLRFANIFGSLIVCCGLVFQVRCGGSSDSGSFLNIDYDLRLFFFSIC